jgi:hypothetical protein
MDTTTPPTATWRVRVNQDISSFARDRVDILLAARNQDGIRLAEPVAWTLGDPQDPAVAPDVEPLPWLVLPTEAAQALFDALAAHFLGTSDVIRLSRDLAAERRRVDALIAGIGRIGAQPRTEADRAAS